MGLNVLGWRNVPVDKRVCGKDALSSLPDIQQIIITGVTSCMKMSLKKNYMWLDFT